LLERVELGGEVIISRAGTPVAKLVAVAASKRVLGADRGRVRIAADFDAPLPDEVLARHRHGPQIRSGLRVPRRIERDVNRLMLARATSIGHTP
jgi:antitoxin (DNA-binding transcriptional repressor) of toxin-antitoxin stability system